MWSAAVTKYQTSRPATLEEYLGGKITNMPGRNDTQYRAAITFLSNFDEVHPSSKKHNVGIPGVLWHDQLDCTLTSENTRFTSGRHAVMCVIPEERIARQPSLGILGARRVQDL
jgi:hypothetical protein